jgi:hypothetical protein
LRITSIKSARDAGAFLDYLTSWPGSNGLFVQNLTDSSRISAASPIIIAPNQKAGFSFFFDLSSVQGDSIIMDTLYVETNDFHNPLLKIPFTIEYNDLPTLTVYQIHNATSTAQTTSRIAPFFPIYSSLVFAFSEPVDTRNIQDKIKIYSYPDSTARGTAGISPIESAPHPPLKLSARL